MKHFLLSAAAAAAFAIALPAASIAQQPFDAQKAGLSQPVIALTPTLAKNADALKLTEEQRAAVAAWMAEAPGKRMAVEREAFALRTELRAKIASGAPAEEREALARQIGDKETELLMMRSNCVDHWRSQLSPEQFAQLLQMAGVTE